MKHPPPQMELGPPHELTKMSVSWVVVERPTRGFDTVMVLLTSTLNEGRDGSPQQKK